MLLLAPATRRFRRVSSVDSQPHPRATTNPSSCSPMRIAHTYLGSITTAFPNVSRSGGRCSSIQEKAEGERGRRRKREPWFSQMKSGLVGDVPLVAYALSSIVSFPFRAYLPGGEPPLSRDTVGGSEVCRRLNTSTLYHNSDAPEGELRGRMSKSESAFPKA